MTTYLDINTPHKEIPINIGDESMATWFQVPYQSIVTRRETNQCNRALHKHDFIELVIILNGQGTHIIEDAHHSVQAGDTFVVAPNIQHAYADTNNLGLFNILIRNQYLQTLNHEYISMPGFYALFLLEPRMRAMHQFKSQLQLSPQALAEIGDWINCLEVEAQQTTPLACSRARAFLQLIVGNLCMQYEALGSLDSTKLLHIANCIRYMDNHLNSSLQLADLAHAAGMSERSLSRNFHATIGQSPIEYLLNMRLQRAEELLLGSPTPISQIAYEVGFSDANYFTRQFHRLKGMSPRTYRKQFEKHNIPIERRGHNERRSS
jgi:AraC family L-rhamnose operon transcriptional activator RhaR/AraC family L-rhamnose operon regulatory protein RhaS